MAVTTSYQSEKFPCWKGISKVGTAVLAINKVPGHEDIWCHGGTIPYIPKLHTRRRWVDRFMPQSPSPREKVPGTHHTGGWVGHRTSLQGGTLTPPGIELRLSCLWPIIKLLELPWATKVTSPISSVILIQIWQKWIYEIHCTGNNQEDKFLIFLYYFQDNHYVGLTFPKWYFIHTFWAHTIKL